MIDNKHRAKRVYPFNQRSSFLTTSQRQKAYPLVRKFEEVINETSIGPTIFDVKTPYFYLPITEQNVSGTFSDVNATQLANTGAFNSQTSFSEVKTTNKVRFTNSSGFGYLPFVSSPLGDKSAADLSAVNLSTAQRLLGSTPLSDLFLPDQTATLFCLFNLQSEISGAATVFKDSACAIGIGRFSGAATNGIRISFDYSVTNFRSIFLRLGGGTQLTIRTPNNSYQLNEWISLIGVCGGQVEKTKLYVCRESDPTNIIYAEGGPKVGSTAGAAGNWDLPGGEFSQRDGEFVGYCAAIAGWRGILSDEDCRTWVKNFIPGSGVPTVIPPEIPSGF